MVVALFSTCNKFCPLFFYHFISLHISPVQSMWCLVLGVKKEACVWVMNNFLWSRPSGLPPPALQALCKLITASEAGEQLINRVGPCSPEQMLLVFKSNAPHWISLGLKWQTPLLVFNIKNQWDSPSHFLWSFLDAFLPLGSCYIRILQIYHCVTSGLDMH